ncbi:MAG TPA: glycosyltransferase [Thermoanaerobaculia bacterium]
MISVIVPIRSERPEERKGLDGLVRGPDFELVIAGGEGSRGSRLAAAASRARGETFFFLHADSRPPDGALDLIRKALEDGADAGAFSLAYEGDRRTMRWIAWWANRRSRAWKLPLGDQGIFCRRSAYERSGGFRDLPICDDLDFVLRLRRVGRFVVRPEKTRTSPRRYVEVGAMRQVLRTRRVMVGYFAGVAPEKLVRWYEGR